MILRKNHHKDNILLYILYVIVICMVMFMFMSCHVSRQVQTSHVNTDSVVNHVRDSSAEVLKETTESFNEMIKQLTEISVTFENDCPDLTAIRESLDSIGKVNFDLAMHKDSVIHSLNNKVKILADGSIEASGRIKSANFSNNKLTEDNHLLTTRNDSLWRVVDSQRVELSKKVEIKTVVVKKTFIPWWMWLVAGLGFVLWFYKLIPKRPI